MHGIVVGHFFSNMDVILERYQRYSFEERAVLDPNIGGQANWGDEYGRLKIKLDALQKSQKYCIYLVTFSFWLCDEC